MPRPWIDVNPRVGLVPPFQSLLGPDLLVSSWSDRISGSKAGTVRIGVQKGVLNHG